MEKEHGGDDDVSAGDGDPRGGDCGGEADGRIDVDSDGEYPVPLALIPPSPPRSTPSKAWTSAGSEDPLMHYQSDDEHNSDMWELYIQFDGVKFVQKSMRRSDIRFLNLLSVMEKEGYGICDTMHYVKYEGEGLDGLAAVDSNDKVEEMVKKYECNEKSRREELKKTIAEMKRKRADPLLHCDGDTDVEDIFVTDQDGSEETIVEEPVKKKVKRKGPTTRSHSQAQKPKKADWTHDADIEEAGFLKEEDDDGFEPVSFVQPKDRKSRAKKAKERVWSDPNTGISSIIDKAKKDFGVQVNKRMAYRAKNHAREMVLGDHKKQYHRIRDYLHTVIEKNPGSRCIVTTITGPTEAQLEQMKRGEVVVISDSPRFHGLFFCVNAARLGFLEGCRLFIGLDGCFINLTTGAQILAATGRDGNNNMYPLAWVVVAKEDTTNWLWFLEQLKYAIGGDCGKYGPYTIMSDRQRGLIKAVSTVFPNSPVIYCLRHIYANLQTASFRGEDLKKCMDNATYSFTRDKFDIAMEELKKQYGECDEKRIGARTAKWEITPHYAEKLELMKKYSRNCVPIRSDIGLWQVKSGNHAEEVNLDAATCSCRKWDMTGLPCNHTVSAIYKARMHPEDFVSDFFKKPMYINSYRHIFCHMPEQHGWTKTNTPDIMPPSFNDHLRGRRQEKGRKGKFEVPKPKETSRMATITCKNCKLQGHKYVDCLKELRPDLAIRKDNHRARRSLSDEGPCTVSSPTSTVCTGSSSSPQAPPVADPRPPPVAGPRPPPGASHGDLRSPFTAPRPATATAAPRGFMSYLNAGANAGRGRDARKIPLLGTETQLAVLMFCEGW
ncbi:unnamed protein product [Alopecurus aequalis]